MRVISRVDTILSLLIPHSFTSRKHWIILFPSPPHSSIPFPPLFSLCLSPSLTIFLFHLTSTHMHLLYASKYLNVIRYTIFVHRMSFTSLLLLLPLPSLLLFCLSTPLSIDQTTILLHTPFTHKIICMILGIHIRSVAGLAQNWLLQWLKSSMAFTKWMLNQV